MNKQISSIKQKKGGKISRFLLNYAVYVIGIGLLVIFGSLSTAFFTPSNIVGMLQDNTPLLAAAIGVTFVLLVGQLDLSVGSIVLTSISLGGLCMNTLGLNPYLCLIIMALIGAGFGALNAVMIVKVKMNALLVTMAMQIALKGFAFLFTGAAPVPMPEAIKALRMVHVFGIIPLHVFITLVLAVVMQIIIWYTKFGRNVITVGANPEAAAKIGINVSRIKMIVFTMSGLFAGVAAAMMAINLGNATLTSGSGYEFLAVTAIVLGGTSLFGGAGSVIPGTLCGVVILGILENGLSIMGVDPYSFGLIRGAIIFFAMYIDAIKNKE